MSRETTPIIDLKEHFQNYITTLNALTHETIPSLQVYLDPQVTIYNNHFYTPEEYTTLIVSGSKYDVTHLAKIDEDQGIIVADLIVRLPLDDAAAEGVKRNVIKMESVYKWDMETGRMKTVQSREEVL